MAAGAPPRGRVEAKGGGNQINQRRSIGEFKRGEVGLDQLLSLMGGGAELTELAQELEQLRAAGASQETVAPAG